MDITDFVSPECAMIDVRASDKSHLLNDLAQRAAATLGVSSDQVSAELLKREALGSTGTGGGVAIPHARLPGFVKPFGVLVRLAKAIDFDSIDGQPVDIVFMLLLPTNSPGGQLNALAFVARILRDPETVRCLRRAADGAELYSIMVSKAQK